HQRQRRPLEPELRGGRRAGRAGPERREAQRLGPDLDARRLASLDLALPPRFWWTRRRPALAVSGTLQPRHLPERKRLRPAGHYPHHRTGVDFPAAAARRAAAAVRPARPRQRPLPRYPQLEPVGGLRRSRRHRTAARWRAAEARLPARKRAGAQLALPL